MLRLLLVGDADGCSVDPEEGEEADEEEPEDDADNHAGPDVGVLDRVVGELALGPPMPETGCR